MKSQAFEAEPAVLWKERWVLVVLISAAARVGAACVVPLLPEEAYHWCYARHPALSYYDHPPMIAWMIALGRLIFGDSVLGVRFVPLIGSVVTTGAVGWVSRRLHGAHAAAWTVFLLSLQPASLLGFGFGFPDAPLALFWSLGMVCLVKALDGRNEAWWMGVGAALGAALLSKYTACFFAASVFIYLVASPRDRRWLRSPWPYAALLVAGAVFSPVLCWNATHDWASFRFQSLQRLEDAGAPRIRLAAGFLAGQVGALLPLTLPLAITAVRQGFRRRSEEDRLLLCLSLPTLLLFFLIGTTRTTHVFWPMPAYLALTVAMGETAARAAGRVPRWYRAFWRELLALSAVAAMVAAVHALHPLPFIRPLRSGYDWEVIAARTQELRDTLPPDSFVIGVGRRYLCAAQLAFHARDPQCIHGKNLLGEDGLQFAYWAEPEALRGKDAVIVAEADWDPNLEDRLRKFFTRVEKRGDHQVSVCHDKPGRSGEERYLFFVAHGYRGL